MDVPPESVVGCPVGVRERRRRRRKAAFLRATSARTIGGLRTRLEQTTGDPRADRALVEDVLRGSAEAVDAFVARMRCVPRFLSALDRRLGSRLSRDELADVAQDTLAQVWRKLPTYAGLASLESWVYRFCALELLNVVRKRREEDDRRLERSGEPAAAPVPADPLAVDVERIHEALGRLRPEEEQAVRLRHFGELTFDEIGVRMGVVPSTAKALYYRGMDKLRDILKPHLTEETP